MKEATAETEPADEVYSVMKHIEMLLKKSEIIRLDEISKLVEKLGPVLNADPGVCDPVDTQSCDTAPQLVQMLIRLEADLEGIRDLVRELTDKVVL